MPGPVPGRFRWLASLAASCIAALMLSAAAGAAPLTIRQAAEAERIDAPRVALERVVTGLSMPVQITFAPGDPDRLFIVEKTGAIRVFEEGRIAPEPLLDLRGEVSSGYEQGLLSVAFHPGFSENRTFFVNYTDRRGDTVIARYQTQAGRYVADPASRRVILTLRQPAANHNGGMMAFGPDGYLYIGTGDGGGAGDPWGSGQDLGTLLGKMLRIDVDGGEPYRIPQDNPFTGTPGARGEIWAWGLRNPWRFSFDRTTGDLYIADVGQNAWEEVNLQPASSRGGENYGWNRMEGSHCYPGSRSSCQGEFVLPVVEYSHALGCSVTGGFVYRGRRIPELYGHYIFGDYCSGRIWALYPPGDDGGRKVAELLQPGFPISTFGEDAAGELYVAHMSAGALFKLVPAR